jgi:hypothetical protein
MRHLVLIGAMVVTCVLTAVANVLFSRILGINFFTLKFWFIVPGGAGICGFLGASGAMLAARYFNIRPTGRDAIAMVVVAAATMVLIYYLDYATLVLANGRKASDLVDFATFVDLALTKSHMRAGRAVQIDAGEVGQWGYALAAAEFIGFLVGGAVTFLLIRDLPRCAECDSYLRKLKTKKSPELTFDEAGRLVEMLREGDLAAVKDAIAWTPQARRLGMQRAVLLMDLHGCSHCKAEAIIVTVEATQGGDWKEVPSLETRRNLAGGVSLRDQFA